MDLNEKGLKAAIEAYDTTEGMVEKAIEAAVRAYVDVIGDLVKAAEKDRDNALAIARKNHDQWAELDRASRAAPVAALEAAGRAIQRSPYGCVFCDSGKLRNPAKPHDETCGFALLDAALAPAPEPTFAEINAAARAEIDRRGLTPNVRMKVWRALKDARFGLSLAAHYDANSDMPNIRRSVDEALALLTPTPEESEIV